MSTEYSQDFRYINLIDKFYATRKKNKYKQEWVCHKLGKYSSWLSKIETFQKELTVLEVIELLEFYKIKDLNYFLSNSK